MRFFHLFPLKSGRNSTACTVGKRPVPVPVWPFRLLARASVIEFLSRQYIFGGRYPEIFLQQPAIIFSLLGVQGHKIGGNVFRVTGFGVLNFVLLRHLLIKEWSTWTAAAVFAVIPKCPSGRRVAIYAFAAFLFTPRNGLYYYCPRLSMFCQMILLDNSCPLVALAKTKMYNQGR